MYDLMFEPTARLEELMPTSVSVVCVIGGQDYPTLAATSMGSLLLVRHHNGQWGLPSGRVKPDEDEEVAWRRELYEETHLTQHDIVVYRGPRTKFFSTRIGTGDIRTYPSITITRFAYLIRNLPPEGVEIPDSKEISLVRQFSIRDLLSLLQEPNRIRIKHHNIPMIKQRIISWLGIRYAFEGPDFYYSLARRWGIVDE